MFLWWSERMIAARGHLIPTFTHAPPPPSRAASARPASSALATLSDSPMPAKLLPLMIRGADCEGQLAEGPLYRSLP